MFICRNKKLEINRRTLIMGIINVTPDSFSDGGTFLNSDAAIKHAKFLVKCGADIIDIGGESTRPFADNISIGEEISRVIPVIKVLSKQISVPISVDTTKADVAIEAIVAGASIVNDISALSFDSKMAEIVAKYGAGVILMHMKGNPKNMQLDPYYDDLLDEIKSFLSRSIDMAISAGINKSSIIIDPGIGFGKTVEHNLEIISRLKEISDLEVPILVGPSRKMFIRKILSYAGDEIDPTSDLVENGTQATVAAAAINGANIVRVHNVSNTFATLQLINSVKSFTV